MLSCANGEITRIRAFMDGRDKVNVQGPPGTGKTWLMAKLMATEQKAGAALTVTNEAAINLFEEIKSQRLMDIHLILTPSRVKESRRGTSWGKHFKNKWTIGTLGYLGERLKDDYLNSLWIDESSTMESRWLNRYEVGRIRCFGDIYQLGPFSGEKSVAEQCADQPNWGQIKLNLTHRLSLASILPILRFYPNLTPSKPIQGLLVGNRYLEGVILIPFETDTVNESNSRTTVYERRWVTRAAEALRRAQMKTIVSSPYRGFCDQTAEKSVNQIQGLTTQVLILALTNREVNDFCCQPERLLVAITRATKVTMIVGRIDRLRMKRSWFEHSEIAPPRPLLEALENSVITDF
jgi:RecA/RadA recombinase